jgi:hypothetical protein
VFAQFLIKQNVFRIVFWDVLPCKIIVDRRWWSLMMEAARTSETSVDNYFTRQYIPEDNPELHTRHHENLKSQTECALFLCLCMSACTYVPIGKCLRYNTRNEDTAQPEVIWASTHHMTNLTVLHKSVRNSRFSLLFNITSWIWS